MTIAQAQWILREADENRIRVLQENPDVSHLPPVVHRLLVQRGVIEAAEVRRFLHPMLRDLADPFDLPDMELAVARVAQAIDKREKVLLYGDYDVDGVTSIAIMTGVLESYGLQPAHFLPHRLEEGYGLSHDGIERCLDQGRPDLLMAIDCGTTSIDEIERLGREGVDVVVLDHHEASSRGRPLCVAVVNPKLGSSHHYLCSAGVVFKFAHALLKRKPNPGLDLREYLDLIALGSVADIVPLVDDNRILVRKGIERIQHTTSPGLAALKRECRLNGCVRASDIGFRLGPRLNAAGRVDNARRSLDLLLTRDLATAERLARELDEWNRRRQQVELQMTEEALAMVEETFDPVTHHSIVVGSDAWHPGVVGIVASRLTKRFHRPTFVVAFDENGIGKGSGRSVEDISLVRALRECDDLILKGGGHDLAAGLSIEREHFEMFRERFEQAITGIIRPEQLIPKLYFDAETRLAELELDLLDSYELLEPFGAGNPVPVFVARGVSVSRAPRQVGERHLQMELVQDGSRRPAIFFGGSETPLPRLPWDVGFTIQRNEFRGRVSLQMHITALRSSA